MAGALLSIFKRPDQRLVGPAPEDGGLLLDAVLTETIEHEAAMTQFPVEIGADISDHLILRPVTYVFQGAVSDHALHWGTTQYNHTDSTTRHLAAYAILRDIWAAREPFTMRHGFLELEDCVLVSFKPVKDADTSNMLIFEARIQQAIIVETREEAVTEDQVAAGGQAEGSVPPENTGPQTGKPAGTLASGIADAVSDMTASAAEYLEGLF